VNAPGNILLYDGVCNLCSRLVIFIIKQDKKGKIRFASLQSRPGKSYLQILGLNPLYIDSLIFIESGIFYKKSSAVLHLLKVLGRGWSLFYGFIIIPAFIRNFFYDIISGSRYKIFGRADICIAPSADTSGKILQ
jgi:predicted DCC family thiol-disulfide oxidoreductase YuxK